MRTSSLKAIPIGFYSVRTLLGLLLLTAAGLKAYALWNGYTTSVQIFSSMRSQIALIEVETLFGLWLFVGIYLQLCWLLTFCFFTISATVSVYLAVSGQPSCGCFGHITVSPWLSFVLDVIAVSAMFFWRPPKKGIVGSNILAQDILKTGLGTATFLLLIGGVFVLTSYEKAGALFLLRGESISVAPHVCEIGDGIVGTHRNFAIKLTNHTNHPITVLGGTHSPFCIATADLPITVPADDFRLIEVQLTFWGGIRRFERSFFLYTDDAKQPIVSARIAGRTIESP